jgi:hypothetical protein
MQLGIAMLARLRPFAAADACALCCSDDDISDVMQEITALANCQCDQITRYYDSFMLPDSSKLLIAMELMACSGADLVSFDPCA